MTPKKQTQTQHNEDLDGRVSLLEYQFAEIFKKLDRMEAKQDAASQKLDTLQYVPRHELDLYKEYVDKRYATKEEGRPMRTLFWAIITAMILGLVSLMFYLIQRAIDR